MKHVLATSLVILTLLSGCSDVFQSTLKPDYTIKVMNSQNGAVAVPPNCPSWNDDLANPFDGQPVPQFGCSNARNLALMIENPNDLVEGRPEGNARGVTTVGAIRRYDNNQTRGLVWTGNESNAPAATTAPTAASPLTGDAGPVGSSGSTQ